MMASSESGGSGSSAGCRVRSVKLVRRAPPAKLGFSVRGGREHGTGFFVTSVETQSEAHCAGLRAGDQIIRVNGYPVDDATHGELLQLIQGHTSLVLRVRSVGMIPEKEEGSGELSWRIVEPDSLTWSPELSEPLNRHTEVPLSIKIPPKAKLGCGICKGPDWKPGIFVQFTKENSIARTSGLRPGDQIVQCNNIQFTPDMPFNEAVSIMRGCGVLELIVKKGAGLELFPGESSGYNSSASSVAGDHPASSWEHASTVTNGDNPAMWNNGNNVTVDHTPPTWNNNSSLQNKNTNIIKQNGTCMPEKRITSKEGNSTIIQVTPPLLHSSDSKVAEICMVSQQTETKTTTVLVEVHHSEEDSVSNSQSDASTDRQTSSSMSSFTSSAGSLRCAISQELQRRSKRPPTAQNQPTEKLIKSGLTKEEVHQHEQLMNEFKKAHHKMFPHQTAKEREEEKQAEPVKEVKRVETNNKAKSRTEDTSRTRNKIEDTGRTRNKTEDTGRTRNRPEDTSRTRNKTEDTSRTRNKKPPPPPPPMPNGIESKQKKGPAPAPPAPSEPPPMPPSDVPSCPTPDYDCLSLASDCQQACDRVDMQSLESFRLTNPQTGRPKPPDTYFPKVPIECRSSVVVRPLVTVGQYGGDAARPRIAKLDFLNQPAPAPPTDQPLQIRLASELSHTLARSTLKDSNNTQAVNGTSNNVKSNGHINGCKGSIIKISVENNKDNAAINGKKPAPFYLFPEGGRRNTTVSFDLSGTDTGRTHTHQHGGILKNSNVSHVQIQPHSDKAIPHKSIKFGPITTVTRDSREPKA